MLGTTALILSGNYLDQEFIRVGYYIHNGFKGDQEHAELDINEVIEQSERTIIAEKPRITKF
jgi:histone chaperone ASF1